MDDLDPALSHFPDIELALGEERLGRHFLFPTISTHLLSLNSLNPLTLKSDQDRISPYNINTMSRRQGVGIKRNIS